MNSRSAFVDTGVSSPSSAGYANPQALTGSPAEGHRASTSGLSQRPRKSAGLRRNWGEPACGEAGRRPESAGCLPLVLCLPSYSFGAPRAPIPVGSLTLPGRLPSRSFRKPLRVHLGRVRGRDRADSAGQRRGQRAQSRRRPFARRPGARPRSSSGPARRPSAAGPCARSPPAGSGGPTGVGTAGSPPCCSEAVRVPPGTSEEMRNPGIGGTSKVFSFVSFRFFFFVLF